MAIKVIQAGTPREEIPNKVTCMKCNSKLEFLAADADIVMDRNERCYVITCPVCKAQVYKFFDFVGRARE